MSFRNHSRGQLVPAICMCVLAMCCQTALAGHWSMTWEVTNNTGQECNDFEVKVEGANIHHVVGVYMNGVDKSVSGDPEEYFKQPTIGDAVVNTGSITTPIEWTEMASGFGSVPPNKTLTFGVGFQTSEDPSAGALGWQVTDVYWTQHAPGMTTISHETRVSGFKVAPSDSANYTIYNDTILPMEVHDLQFLVSSTQIPLDQMVYGNLPGFGTTQPMYTLQPGQSQIVHVTNISPGDYLLAQGIMTPPGGLPTDSIVKFVHQASVVPEPGVLALIVTGLLVVSAGAMRRRA